MPHAVGQREDRRVTEFRGCRPGIVGDLPRDHAEAGNTKPGRQFQDAPDHLPVEARGVELAFARHDEVRGLQERFQADDVGNDVEPGLDVRADRSQATGESARRTATLDGRDVDPGSVVIHRRQLFQTASEQPDLRGRRALLRPEDRRRVEELGAHVARDDDLDPAERPIERLHGGESAIGGGAPTDADDDPHRRPPRIAAAISSPVPRVLASSASRRSRSTSARPLARAISMIAVPSGSTAHSASTGSPSGPVTCVTRDEPPRRDAITSSVPSPPSASGSSMTVS